MNWKIKYLTLFASSLLLSTGLHSAPAQAQSDHYSSQGNMSTPGGISGPGEQLYTPQVNPGADPGQASVLEPGANAGDIPALGAYYDARNPGGTDLGVDRSSRSLPLETRSEIRDQTLMNSHVDQQLQDWQVENNQAGLTEDADDADPVSAPISQALLWLAVGALSVSALGLGYITYRKQQQPFN